MTYEKEIPDYAMVPAKEIEEKIISANEASDVETATEEKE